MTEKRIERHSSVIEQDLPGIYAFIAKDDPAAAEHVLGAIEETFRQISGQPECGMIFRTRNLNLQRLRILPVSGFRDHLVFYRDDEESIRSLCGSWRKASAPVVSTRAAHVIWQCWMNRLRNLSSAKRTSFS